MKHLKWLIAPLFMWAVLPCATAQAPDPHMHKHHYDEGPQFVLEIRPALQYVGKGFGKSSLTLPVQTGPGRFVNATVTLSPDRTLLFSPALLVGARFGEGRRWEVLAGPNFTRNVSGKSNPQQIFVLGTNVYYQVRAGQSWQVGGQAELTRMLNDNAGIFVGYGLVRYPIEIVSGGPGGTFSGWAETKQKLQQVVVGPKFRFGRAIVFLGIGAAYGTTTGQYSYPGQWGLAAAGGVGFQVF